MSRLSQGIFSFSKWLGDIPLPLFCTILGAMVLLRVGFWPTRWLVPFDVDPAQGPLPWSVTRVADALGVLDGPDRWVLGSAIGLLAIAGILFLVRRRVSGDIQFRIALIALAASPLAMVTLGMTRWAPDSIALLGFAAFVLAARYPSALAGILLAALTHPDQTLVAALLVALVAWSNSWLPRRRLTIGVLIAVAVFLGSYLAMVVLGGTGSSRLRVNIESLGQFAISFITDYSAALYGTIGAGLFFIAWFFLISTRATRVRLIVAGTIAVLMVISTWDGTRVFAGVFSATYLFIVVTVTNSYHLQEGKPANTNNLGGPRLDLGIAASVTALSAPVAWIVSVGTLGGLPLNRLLEVGG